MWWQNTSKRFTLKRIVITTFGSYCYFRTKLWNSGHSKAPCLVSRSHCKNKIKFFIYLCVLHWSFNFAVNCWKIAFLQLGRTPTLEFFCQIAACLGIECISKLAITIERQKKVIYWTTQAYNRIPLIIRYRKCPK